MHPPFMQQAGAPIVDAVPAARPGCPSCGPLGSIWSEAGQATMTFVGAGGSYVEETTYRYVGPGAGAFDIKVPKPRVWPLCLGPVLVVVAAGLTLLLLWPGLAPKASQAHARKETVSCLLWGESHVRTFDGSFPNFYSEGDYWVVKGRRVAVQARHLATASSSGLPVTKEIVIGGPSAGEGVLSVGPMEDARLLCGDEPILQEFPSSGTCGDLRLGYNSYGDFAEGARPTGELRIVHVNDPKSGMHMQIFRWANHLNARITMPLQEGGVDGTCGNMNSNATDDTTEELARRGMGRTVQGDANMFMVPALSGRQVEHKVPDDCPRDRRQHAKSLCQEASPQLKGEYLAACVFDVCFGGEHFAEEDALTAG